MRNINYITKIQFIINYLRYRTKETLLKTKLFYFILFYLKLSYFYFLMLFFSYSLNFFYIFFIYKYLDT